MDTKTRAKLFGIAAPLILLAGCLLGVALPRLYLVWAAAGFLGYVACARRALVLLRLDDKVFDHPHGVASVGGLRSGGLRPRPSATSWDLSRWLDASFPRLRGNRTK